MRVFTVHQPTNIGDDLQDTSDRIVFVRDKFSVWAFLLGPLWMIRYRLWLVLILYLALGALFYTGLVALRAPSTLFVIVHLVVATGIGLEASSLRRWTLARRGFEEIGTVIGDRLEDAERRFFQISSDVGVRNAASAPRSVSPAPSDVIGLFPDPQR